MLPGHRIYVGTIGEGLWRSSDGGDSFVRAAETLGLLRDPATAPALIALSRDPRETVRRAAI